MPLTRAERQRLVAIARGRDEGPVRLLEGKKAVLDALPLGVVKELYLADDVGEAGEVLSAQAAQAGLQARAVGPGELARLADTVSPQGVLAVVNDTAQPLERVLARAGLFVWLDGVQDPGNVGAVVRAAAAFGVAGLLVGSGSADPLGLKALRASAGLALRLPFARAAATEIAAALKALRGKPRPVWLLEKGGRDVFEAGPAPAGLVLVLGSEGAGPSAHARGVASGSVGIAIAPEVESLNAAVAMGIVLGVLSRGAAGRGPGQGA